MDETDATVFEFLRRHLAGERTPDRSAVRFYLQNHGGYLEDRDWPPSGTRFGRLYLSRGQLVGDEPSGRSTSSYFTNPSARIQSSAT
jgi:predicted acyl esterase